MRKSWIISMVVAVWATSAFAGEGLFGRVYTVETVPGGHFEVEQVVRNRTGRAYGRYTAFDFRSEFEYGVTDNFQAAVYLNTGYIHAKNAPDDDAIPEGETSFSTSKWYVQGISLEFIYRILSPVSDPIGLALYIEPEFHFHDLHNGRAYDHSYGTEYRLMLQKNLLDDQLILAYNMVTELEFIRFEGEENWGGELDWNHEFGASYRVASNWYAGLEFRNHNEIGDFKVHEHSVFWLGPSIHYGSANWWATLSVLKQVYGNPNQSDGPDTMSGGSLFLRSHESWEVTSKVAFAF